MNKRSRISLILFIALSTISLTSCTKDYICRCKITSTGMPGLPEPIINEYEIKDKPDDAKRLCEDASSYYEDKEFGIKTVEECALL